MVSPGATAISRTVAVVSAVARCRRASRSMEKDKGWLRMAACEKQRCGSCPCLLRDGEGANREGPEGLHLRGNGEESAAPRRDCGKVAHVLNNGDVVAEQDGVNRTFSRADTVDVERVDTDQRDPACHQPLR